MAEPNDTIDLMDLEELQGPEQVQPVPVPTPLTSQLVRDVVADLINVEENNGYYGIAKSRGLLVSQVKLIDQVRWARIAELTPQEIEMLAGEMKVK